MAQDEFTKLFTHMNERFDAIESKLDEKAEKKQAEQLLAAVADLAADIKTYHEELLALGHKVDGLRGGYIKLPKKPVSSYLLSSLLVKS